MRPLLAVTIVFFAGGRCPLTQDGLGWRVLSAGRRFVGPAAAWLPVALLTFFWGGKKRKLIIPRQSQQSAGYCSAVASHFTQRGLSGRQKGGEEEILCIMGMQC